MIDWATISSLATAGGTLVLAVATFSSVKSSNRSARVAELSLLTGLRPVLIPSRDEDPVQSARFGDGVLVRPPGHGGVVLEHDDQLFLAISLRNGGSGLGVIHGWRARTPGTNDQHPPLEEFRRQQVDIYVPAGDLGYWFGRLRGPEDEGYEAVRGALSESSPQPIQVDLLYGDHEGGQRTIVRFVMSAGGRRAAAGAGQPAGHGAPLLEHRPRRPALISCRRRPAPGARARCGRRPRG